MTYSTTTSTVAHLSLMAGLTRVFAQSSRAQALWNEHHAAQLGEMPAQYIVATDGMAEIEGLLIHGDWDPEVGWDLDGLLHLLCEDGEIIRLRGWMATALELL